MPGAFISTVRVRPTMPREGRTSITVKEDTFEMLRRNKPDGVTWDYHLKQLQYASDKEDNPE